MEQNGQRFYVNPSQVNVSGCTDVAPDDRYSCDQQVSDISPTSKIYNAIVYCTALAVLSPIIKSGHTCQVPGRPPAVGNQAIPQEKLLAED